MTYVLIILYWTSHAASGAMATAEFSSQEKCEKAASAAKAKFEGWTGHIDYACVLK